MSDIEFEQLCLESTLRTLALKPTDILQSQDRLPDNRNDPLLRIARPTWIGRNYKTGGILLLAKNPGGGTEANKESSHPSDPGLAKALARLTERKDKESYQFWRDVAQLEAMKSWRVWRNSVKAVIEALGVDENGIAFGNFVPFRTVDNKVKQNEIVRGWEVEVKPLVSILKPRLIVKMTAAFPKFSEQCRFSQVLRFRRANGDWFITPHGYEDLKEIGLFTK